MSMPKDFFSINTLSDLSGAATADLILTHTIHGVSSCNQQKVTLVISLLLAYTIAGMRGELRSISCRLFPGREFFLAVSRWLLPILNASLLFSIVTATDGSQAVTPTRNDAVELSRMATTASPSNPK